IVDAVPGRTERLDDAEQGGGGVEGDGVADATAFGRVPRQDETDPLLLRWDAAQIGGADGETGEALGAVRDRPMGGDRDTELIAVVDDLLEREGGADDAAVELG